VFSWPNSERSRRLCCYVLHQPWPGGRLGHEAISELASRELGDTVRERVIALIRQDEEFNTFRASCNWGARENRAEGKPLDDAEIECLIGGLRLVTPCTQRIDRLIDLLEQIRGGGQRATGTRVIGEPMNAEPTTP
jgi:hypothetical protein